METENKLEQSGGAPRNGPAYGSKISFADWLIYRLFRWRWNRIFLENPQMWNFFVKYGCAWIEQEDEVRLKILGRDVPCDKCEGTGELFSNVPSHPRGDGR